jgi:hypothetical protein
MGKKTFGGSFGDGPLSHRDGCSGMDQLLPMARKGARPSKKS